MMDARPAVAAPPTIRREDYRPPDWLVPEIELEFDLDPARTVVRARLTVERNGDHRLPLRLDGDDLTPLSVHVDGAKMSKHMDGAALLVPIGSDRAVVETEVAIAPEKNSRLIAGLASALLQLGDVCRGMVVFAVGMSRRIMGLRGTVLPMFVTHAPGRSP